MPRPGCHSRGLRLATPRAVSGRDDREELHRHKAPASRPPCGAVARRRGAVATTAAGQGRDARRGLRRTPGRPGATGEHISVEGVELAWPQLLHRDGPQAWEHVCLDDVLVVVERRRPHAGSDAGEPLLGQELAERGLGGLDIAPGAELVPKGGERRQPPCGCGSHQPTSDGAARGSARASAQK